MNRPGDEGATMVCDRTGDETGTMTVGDSGESDGTAGFKTTGTTPFSPFETVEGTTGRTARASLAAGPAIARSSVGKSGFGKRSAISSRICAVVLWVAVDSKPSALSRLK